MHPPWSEDNWSQLPPLERGKRWDCLVVGCGGAACFAALRLAEGGARVALLADPVQIRLLSRLPGVALPATAEHYWSLVQGIGRAQTAQWWRLAVQGAAAVRDLILDSQAPPNCSVGSVMQLAVNPAEAAEMSRGLQWMKEDGFESRMMGGAASSNYAPVAEPEAALFLPGAAAFDPQWWQEQLLRRLLELKVECFVSPDLDLVAALELAETVLLANGLAALQWLGVGRPWLFPLRGQSQLSQPIRQGLRNSLVALSANRGHEVYRDWGDRFVVAGMNPGAGPDEMTQELEVDLNFCKHLQDFSAQRLSELDGVDYSERWATVYIHTMDGLPLIGPAPGQGRVWLAAGFAGSEWSLGVSAGIELARILGGGPSSLVHLPSASPRRF